MPKSLFPTESGLRESLIAPPPREFDPVREIRELRMTLAARLHALHLQELDSRSVDWACADPQPSIPGEPQGTRSVHESLAQRLEAAQKMLTLLQPAVMQSKTKTQPPRLQAKKNCSKTCVDNVDYYDRMDRPLSQAQPRRRGADPTATRSLETMNLGLTLIGVLGIGVGAFFKLNMLHSEWAFPLLVSGALLAGVGVLGRMLAQLCPEAYTAATPQKVVASSF